VAALILIIASQINKGSLKNGIAYFFNMIRKWSLRRKYFNWLKKI